MPCVMAGLMVYFDTYRFTRKLSLRLLSCSSSGNGPRCFFILSAVCHVRVMTSPTRPIAWESELIMEISPISCSTSSAPMVSGRMRESAKAMSSGTWRSR